MYLDTSSLLKLLLPEPETRLTELAIVSERRVVISALTELETRVWDSTH